MDYKIMEKWEDFLSLEEEWGNLLNEIDEYEVFYEFRWAKCYLETLDQQFMNKLLIIIARDNDKVIGIFPFKDDDGVVRFINTSTVDYSQILISNKVNKYLTIKKSIEYLIDNKKIKEFALTNVPGSTELYALEDVLRKNGYSSFIEENVIVPKLDHGTNQMIFNKKQIKDIERRERNLLRDYKVEENVTNDLTEEIWNFVYDCRVNKYPNNALERSGAKEFYFKLAEELKDYIYINEIRINGKLAAAHLGFIDDKKVYYYIPVYSEKYSRTGVGQIMLNNVIKNNIETRTFDSLRGNEDYKFNYCNRIDMNFYLFAYKSNGRNFMQIALNKLKNNRVIRKCLGR